MELNDAERLASRRTNRDASDGSVYVPEICERLKEYESNRNRYSSLLIVSIPEIVKTFPKLAQEARPWTPRRDSSSVTNNKERQHPGVSDGKTIARRSSRPPGILFFNEIGDECGGLIFDGDQNKGQFLVVSFDKFRDDQTIQLQHLEAKDGSSFDGMTVWDRVLGPAETAKLMEKFREMDRVPNNPDKQKAMKALRETGVFGFERVSVGRGYDQTAAIVLSDTKGRARIKMSVDAMGTPKLEFLDENGKVIYSLPQESKSAK